MAGPEGAPMLQRRVAIGVAAALSVVLCDFLSVRTAVAARADTAAKSAPGYSVVDGRLVDGAGREVVLRGFNVSGEAKLAEHGGLPYADVADARRAAASMRQLAGADAVRFLLSW